MRMRSSGRPDKLTPEQQQAMMRTAAEQTPQEVEFLAEMNGTGPIVWRWIRQACGVEFPERGVWHLLNRMGFSCTRSTDTLAKDDLERQATFRDTFGEQRIRLLHGDIDHRLFEDESIIHDDQAIQRTGFLKDHQKVIPTNGERWGQAPRRHGL